MNLIGAKVIDTHRQDNHTNNSMSVENLVLEKDGKIYYVEMSECRLYISEVEFVNGRPIPACNKSKE